MNRKKHYRRRSLMRGMNESASSSDVSAAVQTVHEAIDAHSSVERLSEHDYNDFLKKLIHELTLDLQASNEAIEFEKSQV
jgi:hypothetical protein